MEHYMLYTFGGIILLICLFAVSTLRQLNKSLPQLEHSQQTLTPSISRLRLSISVGNIALLVISSVIVFGLIWQNRPTKSQAPPSVSEAEKADETPKPTGAPLDLVTATVLTDEASLKAGGERFKNLCAACHGQSGEGLVGPNFCDNNWIHGGDFKDVCKTIAEGVPEKGMIAWSAQLSGIEIKEVASYILSLEGSAPPNQKAPQGEKFDRKDIIPFAIKPATMAAVNIPKIALKGNKKHGESLFNGVLGCAHCHGSNSEGHVDNRNLRNMKTRYAKDAQKVYDTVMEIGRLGTAMPPWAHLTMEEKQDIKTFIFSIQQ